MPNPLPPAGEATRCPDCGGSLRPPTEVEAIEHVGWCDHCSSYVPAPAPAPEGERGTEGTWPADCVQRAFVAGAKWWEYDLNGATMWPSDQHKAEAEAVRRYGSPSSAAAGTGVTYTKQPHGNCPVQAEGFIDGQPFYFRARGESVRIEIGPGNTALVAHAGDGLPTAEALAAMDAVEALGCWRYEEENHDWPAAGWISDDFARAWIALAAVRYRERVVSEEQSDGN